VRWSGGVASGAAVSGRSVAVAAREVPAVAVAVVVIAAAGRALTPRQQVLQRRSHDQTSPAPPPVASIR
jgi:hypothetical protein